MSTPPIDSHTVSDTKTMKRLRLVVYCLVGVTLGLIMTVLIITK